MISRGSFVVKNPEGWVFSSDYPTQAGVGVGVVIEKTGDNCFRVMWPMGGRSDHFGSELVQTNSDGIPISGKPFTLNSIVLVDCPFDTPGFSTPCFGANRTVGTGRIVEIEKNKAGEAVFVVRLFGGPIVICEGKHISQWVVLSGDGPKSAVPVLCVNLS